MRPFCVTTEREHGGANVEFLLPFEQVMMDIVLSFFLFITTSNIFLYFFKDNQATNQLFDYLFVRNTYDIDVIKYIIHTFSKEGNGILEEQVFFWYEN